MAKRGIDSTRRVTRKRGNSYVSRPKPRQNPYQRPEQPISIMPDFSFSKLSDEEKEEIIRVRSMRTESFAYLVASGRLNTGLSKFKVEEPQPEIVEIDMPESRENLVFRGQIEIERRAIRDKMQTIIDNAKKKTLSEHGTSNADKKRQTHLQNIIKPFKKD